MTKKNFTKLSEYLETAKSVGLITHRDGDGDAFGSMLAFGRMLIEAGKKVTYFSNEEIPEIFEFITKEIKFKPSSVTVPVDLLIGFDANSIDRFTNPEIIRDLKASGVPFICLDHHQAPNSEDNFDLYINHLDISCTSELVYEYFRLHNISYDKITATLLLLGIETDTFSLQFTNTTPKTFIAVAELMKKGARLKSVVESALGGRPIPTLKLLGRAIDRLSIDPVTGLALTSVTLEDIKELELAPQATSGVANFLDQVKGVKVVAVMEEKEDGEVKVSLRSNNSEIDVNELARNFGGGGHKKAAGFQVAGDVKSVGESISNYLASKL